MAENKKKRHGESDRKGSHAKNARTTTEFGDTVFCPHCIKNILLPVDNEDPGKFLYLLGNVLYRKNRSVLKNLNHGSIRQELGD